MKLEQRLKPLKAIPKERPIERNRDYREEIRRITQYNHYRGKEKK